MQNSKSYYYFLFLENVFCHQKLWTLHFTGLKAEQNISCFPTFEISIKKQQSQQPPGGLILQKLKILQIMIKW